MAGHTAIAGVSRTLRTLLQDRMVTGAAVTVAPPDETVTGFDGARVNLYPVQIIENAGLKNDHGPLGGHPARRDRPPLSLNLLYMLTSYADSAVQTESDITAQEILGDAMRVLHAFGGRLHGLTLINLAPPAQNEPVLDETLRGDVERLKVTLQPTSLEDTTRIWSALADQSFRRSVFYLATVVQIEDLVRERVPAPVEERRVFATLARRPLIERAFVTPALPGGLESEMRVAVGEEITLVVHDAGTGRLFVQLGELAPMRVRRPVGGRIAVIVPDDVLPLDFDPVVNQPIAPENRLQPGTLPIRLIVEVTAEGVTGGLGRGARVEEPRRAFSNLVVMQLVPQVTGIAPAAGPAGTIITVTGTRLWHAGAIEAQVVVGDGGVDIRAEPGALADPTPTAVEVPVDEAGLAVQSAADPPYPVAVIVDGARSRDASLGFHLDP